MDEILVHLKAKAPTVAWENADEDWESIEDARLEIRRRAARKETRFGMLVAKVDPAFKLPEQILGRTYTVKELYKYVPAGGGNLDLVYFNGTG